LAHEPIAFHFVDRKVTTTQELFGDPDLFIFFERL
jgi:hypothetical protein